MDYDKLKSLFPITTKAVVGDDVHNPFRCNGAATLAKITGLKMGLNDEGYQLIWGCMAGSITTPEKKVLHISSGDRDMRKIKEGETITLTAF